jgi:hypothetical protein
MTFISVKTTTALSGVRLTKLKLYTGISKKPSLNVILYKMTFFTFVYSIFHETNSIVTSRVHVNNFFQCA